MIDSLKLPSNRELKFDKPLVMGILNATPDSFSDGSTLTSEQFASKALTMVEQGADMIDIGGESTRPGADPVDVDEELRRVIPVIEAIRGQSDIPISIDTYKAEVARTALDSGADIVNDISAMRFSADMAELTAGKTAPSVLMHMAGTPQTMQKNPQYENCVEEIIGFFRERITYCTEAGIERSQLIIDPGIGFGKRLSDNLEILANLNRFKALDLPILIGVSRKSFIEKIYHSGLPAEKRIGGSIAAMLAAVEAGANIVRVHDVHETVEALKVWSAIREMN